MSESLADNRTDEELLHAHVCGDKTAFAELAGRHRNRMWAVALRTMRNPDDAADALQDAFISAFRRASTFRGGAAVTTWLHRVVVNACLDRIRRMKVRAADRLPDDIDRSSIAPLAQDCDHPDFAIEQHDVAAQVHRALSQLNTDQRAALILVDMQGYHVDEAAVMLGCAPGTVKSRCSRGRVKLAVLLHSLKPEHLISKNSRNQRASLVV